MPPKRKQADKLRLHQPDTAPTWQDKLELPSTTKTSGKAQPTSPVEEKTEKMYKTYWIDPDIVQAVKNLAETHRVGINELVEFLLTYSMTSIEQNNVEIPVKSSRNKIAR